MRVGPELRAWGAEWGSGAKLDISEYTDSEGRKRPGFRVPGDTYRVL